MARRAIPTQQYIAELTGGNQGLIENMHHGLAETPSLRVFYPFLDLDELAAFAASSRKSRDSRNPDFKKAVESGDPYRIFKEAFRIGFPWLNKHKNISPELRHLEGALNPFSGKDLTRRLDSVPAWAIPAFLNEVDAETKKWVFGCQYDDEKARRGGDNYGIEIMTFQNVYPREGRIVPAYVTEVTRMICSYPREYEAPEKPKVENSPDKPKQQQLF